jgi:Competence protein CoiA-like family
VDLSAEAFTALRAAPGLTMTCCAAGAVPKHSVRGLPFFAHAARGLCEAAGESELHVQAKADILRAARAAGWTADVEVPGQAPGGKRWRADVLCVRGRQRVAFEVQRSGITLSILHARQALYRASGVRGFWLMRTHYRALSQAQPWQMETPAVYLDDQREVPTLGIDLTTFTQAALGGHLALFPRLGSAVDVNVSVDRLRCYRCLRHPQLVRAAFLRPAGQPDPVVVLSGLLPEVGTWLNDVAALGEPTFVSWPTAKTPMVRCPACQSLLAATGHQRHWLDPRPAGSGFSVGQRGVVLGPEQHAWVVRSAGQVWTFRSLL